ncbi:hypothetical protein [Paraburkholderia caledonica]|uniref:Uncharacterized protein n=1 Tax=Paraburkholderia caledonica TaxID=134536 RepID=A0AB73ILS6_9BURK|nr:hypothetical protein [Paraburkholderia caledonica]
MAALLIETANIYCRFMEAEKLIGNLSRISETGSAHSVELIKRLADLCPQKPNARRCIADCLASMHNSIALSEQLQRTATTLMLSPANLRLRYHCSLTASGDQIASFEIAIRQLENLAIVFQAHAKEQQFIRERAEQLIRCLQNTSSWEDI